MAKKKKAKKVKKKKAKVRKPARKKMRPAVKQAKRAKPKRNMRAERELEEGLRETFPGSDPLAQTDPTRSIRE